MHRTRLDPWTWTAGLDEGGGDGWPGLWWVV